MLNILILEDETERYAWQRIQTGKVLLFTEHMLCAQYDAMCLGISCHEYSIKYYNYILPYIVNKKPSKNRILKLAIKDKHLPKTNPDEIVRMS